MKVAIDKTGKVIGQVTERIGDTLRLLTGAGYIYVPVADVRIENHP